MKYIYCCFYVVPKNRIFIEKYILIYEPLLSFYATILKIVLVQDTAGTNVQNIVPMIECDDCSCLIYALA